MILIRLYLLLYNLSFDFYFLDYTLNATPSNNPMSLSNILNSTTESGTGSSNPSPRGNLPPNGGDATGLGVGQNVSMADIIAKLRLQREEVSMNINSGIYYRGYSEAATLNSQENDLLTARINHDWPNSRPYAVITRVINNVGVNRVVQLAANSTRMPNRFDNDVKPTSAFIEYLGNL